MATVCCESSKLDLLKHDTSIESSQAFIRTSVIEKVVAASLLSQLEPISSIRLSDCYSKRIGQIGSITEDCPYIVDRDVANRTLLIKKKLNDNYTRMLYYLTSYFIDRKYRYIIKYCLYLLVCSSRYISLPENFPVSVLLICCIS